MSYETVLRLPAPIPLKFFGSRRLSVSEVEHVRKSKRGKKFRRRACFSNAVRMAKYNTDPFLYTEGYVRSRRIGAFHHAWVTIRGKVVDPTLLLNEADRECLQPTDLPVWRDRVAGVIPSTLAYRGRTFAFPDVAAKLQKEPTWGGMISDGTIQAAYLEESPSRV